MILPTERLPIFRQDPAAKCSRNVLPDTALPVPNVRHTQGASYPNHIVLRHKAEATHDGGFVFGDNSLTQCSREEEKEQKRECGG